MATGYADALNRAESATRDAMKQKQRIAELETALIVISTATSLEAAKVIAEHALRKANEL